MCTEIIHPPDAGEDGCLSESDATLLLHGFYPMKDLDARLDHIDSCHHCAGLFQELVVDAVAYLDCVQGPRAA